MKIRISDRPLIGSRFAMADKALEEFFSTDNFVAAKPGSTEVLYRASLTCKPKVNTAKQSKQGTTARSEIPEDVLVARIAKLHLRTLHMGPPSERIIAQRIIT